MGERARAFLLLVDGTEREVPVDVPHPASAGKITVHMLVPRNVAPAQGWRIEADGLTATGQCAAAPGDVITADINGQGRQKPAPDEMLDAFRDADARNGFEAAAKWARELDEHLSAGGMLPAAWLSAASATGTMAGMALSLAVDASLLQAELTSERAVTARLRAELDQHQPGRVVLLCMARDTGSAQEASRGERDGTILRTTDTGIEWVLASGQWNRAY